MAEALDLDKLEALAKAATPGPWAYRMGQVVQLSDGGQGFPVDYYPDCEDIIAEDRDGNLALADRNAEYIANVSPLTVLELIAHVRALEAERSSFARVSEGYQEGTPQRMSERGWVGKSMVAEVDAMDRKFDELANRMDAPDGPTCACGWPSEHESGSCLHCIERSRLLARISELESTLAAALAELSRARRDADAMRPVVEAACIWRHGMVETPIGLVDADDGNAEQNLMRPPARRVLIDAADAYRARGGG